MRKPSERRATLSGAQNARTCRERAAVSAFAMSPRFDVIHSSTGITYVGLQTFREALAVLQRQVDELDDLKSQHYQDIVVHEEEVWDFVQGKTCLVVRSTLDVFDRLTSKAYDLQLCMLYKHSYADTPFHSTALIRSSSPCSKLFQIPSTPTAPHQKKTRSSASSLPSPSSPTPHRQVPVP